MLDLLLRPQTGVAAIVERFLRRRAEPGQEDGELELDMRYYYLFIYAMLLFVFL